MNCPNCNKILRKIAHVIVECSVGHRLNKTGMRKKEVEILETATKTIFCECGYFEIIR